MDVLLVSLSAVASVTGIYCSVYFGYWAFAGIYALAGGGVLGLLACFLFAKPIIGIAVLIACAWFFITSILLTAIGE